MGTELEDWVAKRYVGAKVATYDAERCHTLRWAHEQQAVDTYVTRGPVLDVPLGTGRFCAIYRGKGLRVTGRDISPDMIEYANARYPWLDATVGNVFDLAEFEDQQFATAVCVRLLDWLSPQQMQEALRSLRRVASELVFSVRHGRQDYDVNWTHDLSDVYEALDGLHVAGRCVTEETEYGLEEMLHVRQPTYDDAAALFDNPNRIRVRPADEITRLAHEWEGSLLKRLPFVIDSSNSDVTATYMRGTDLWSVIQPMGQRDARYFTDEEPRSYLGPVLLLSHRNKSVVLDGRRRINRWKCSTSLFPVLCIRVRSSLPSA